jgi:hypothetical protein
MPFPFSAEGRIEVPISSPDKASRVVEGVRRWAVKMQADDVELEGMRLRFCGSYGPERSRYNPLQGVGQCEIVFQNLPEKVVMDFSVATLPFPWPLLGIGLFLVIAVSGIGDPRRLLFLPLIAIVGYAAWAMTLYEFQYTFRTAAIRGLADGAERELRALQNANRSRVE